MPPCYYTERTVHLFYASAILGFCKIQSEALDYYMVIAIILAKFLFNISDLVKYMSYMEPSPEDA